MTAFQRHGSQALEKDTPGLQETRVHLKGGRESIIIVSFFNKCLIKGELRSYHQVLARTKGKFFGQTSAFPNRNSRRGWVVLETMSEFFQVS